MGHPVCMLFFYHIIAMPKTSNIFVEQGWVDKMHTHPHLGIHFPEKLESCRREGRCAAHIHPIWFKRDTFTRDGL